MLKEYVKEGIAVGSELLMRFPYRRTEALPERSRIRRYLENVYPDHPVYSKNTFQNYTSDEKKDLCIVVPFYNAPGEFMNDCLLSLLHQKTEYSWQIVCVDDGSSDDTLERLKMYEKKFSPKILVIHQENKGVACARNTGIAYSNCRYIGFADQDDWVSEEYVEELLKRAFAADADIVKCSHSVKKNGEVVSTFSVPELSCINGLGSQMLSYSGMIWSGIYRREVFEQIRFPEGYWYEDMVSRMLLYPFAEKFESIDRVMYFKRKHDQNASTVIWNSRKPKCLDHIYLLHHLLEEREKLGLQNDGVFFSCLLRELGQYLLWRTKGMDRTCRKMLFAEACYIADEYGYYGEKDEIGKQYENALRRHNYSLWKAVSWHDWATSL